jgi:hypothetical protein
LGGEFVDDFESADVGVAACFEDDFEPAAVSDDFASDDWAPDSFESEPFSPARA